MIALRILCPCSWWGRPPRAEAGAVAAVLAKVRDPIDDSASDVDADGIGIGAIEELPASPNALNGDVAESGKEKERGGGFATEKEESGAQHESQGPGGVGPALRRTLGHQAHELGDDSDDRAGESSSDDTEAYLSVGGPAPGGGGQDFQGIHWTPVPTGPSTDAQESRDFNSRDPEAQGMGDWEAGWRGCGCGAGRGDRWSPPPDCDGPVQRHAQSAPAACSHRFAPRRRTGAIPFNLDFVTGLGGREEDGGLMPKSGAEGLSGRHPEGAGSGLEGGIEGQGTDGEGKICCSPREEVGEGCIGDGQVFPAVDGAEVDLMGFSGRGAFESRDGEGRPGGLRRGSTGSAESEDSDGRGESMGVDEDGGNGGDGGGVETPGRREGAEEGVARGGGEEGLDATPTNQVVRQFMLNEYGSPQIAGKDNSTKKYHPSKTVKTRLTPFEDRVENEMRRERSALKVIKRRLTMAGPRPSIRTEDDFWHRC
eukprot:evm.model.scf_1171.3 EVM.evm.TU.scf_1171.3   scf_1171:9763-12753(-)